jgi:hypothetical protein
MEVMGTWVGMGSDVRGGVRGVRRRRQRRRWRKTKRKEERKKGREEERKRGREDESGRSREREEERGKQLLSRKCVHPGQRQPPAVQSVHITRQRPSRRRDFIMAAKEKKEEGKKRKTGAFIIKLVFLFSEYAVMNSLRTYQAYHHFLEIYLD